MASTWPKRRQGQAVRNNPWTKTDVLGARRVLRDCYRARHDLATAFAEGDPATCRLRWVTAVILLRTVGHVLDKIDTRRSPALKAVVKATWQGWKERPFDRLIFHGFIEDERNAILKEYRFAHPEAVEGAALPESLLLIGDKSYTPLGAIDAAVAWWEAQLEAIEVKAGG